MKKNTAFKVLSSAALAATVLAPVSAFAATYEVPSVQVVAPGVTNANLGSIKVTFDTALLSTGDTLTVRLPGDFKFNSGITPGTSQNVNFAAPGTQAVGGISINIPSVKNGLVATGTTVEVTNLADNELQFRLAAAPTTNETTGYFYINLDSIEVPGGYSGEVKATLTANPGSKTFSDKEVTLATVGQGTLSASIDSVKTITTSATTVDNIRIKEDRPGAFTTGQTFKIKLPSGFEWDIASSPATTAAVIAGNAPVPGISIDDNGRTLVVTSSGVSTQASTYVLRNVKVKVNDETIAKTGDVEATFSGTASRSTSSLVVAKYGDYGTKVYAVGDPKTVTAGKMGEKIGKFAIEESTPGSLVAGRTITLTLSGKAKWSTTQDTMQVDTTESKNVAAPLSTSEIQRTTPTLIGNSNETLKITLGSGASLNAIKAVIKDAKINVSPEAEGDIKVIVGGTAGVTGELTLAKVQKPVTTKVEGDLPNVVIGSQSQQLGDITVTETASENIDGTLSLLFPVGVTPTLPKSVTVSEGDLVLSQSSVTRTFSDGRWSINVTTRSTSTKPSAIKFSGISVTTDRTVPEGDMAVEVTGGGVMDTNQATGFPGVTAVDKFAVAKVVTPAAGKGGVGTAVFKLNSKSFTVDGKTVEMDVQPLVKWDRAYVPVRFAANALGVADENILWDDKTQTVTIFHNGKVVQMTVGKKEYSVNGVKVAMDVPVFRNKVETNNRTLLPIRYVAQALGVPVNWNQETGEIVLGEQK